MARASPSPRPSCSTAACSRSGSSTRCERFREAVVGGLVRAHFARRSGESNAPCSRSSRSHSAGRSYSTRTARSTNDSTSKRREHQSSFTGGDGRLARRHAASLRQRHRSGRRENRTRTACKATGRRIPTRRSVTARRSTSLRASTAVIREKLFVGPKLQKQLVSLHAGTRHGRRLRRARLPRAPAVQGRSRLRTPG